MIFCLKNVKPCNPGYIRYKNHVYAPEKNLYSIDIGVIYEVLIKVVFISK
jgi:hypothetical protein